MDIRTAAFDSATRSMGERCLAASRQIHAWRLTQLTLAGQQFNHVAEGYRASLQFCTGAAEASGAMLLDALCPAPAGEAE